MEYKQIQELIKVINKSNISELTIEEGDFKITIKQAQTETHYVMPSQQPQLMAPAVPQAIAAAAPAASTTAGAPAPAAAPANDKQVIIKSPMIGTFYRSPTPEKPVFVNVGDEISVGQVLCIVEAMKLFNEIESEIKGKIIKVLIDDASPVEYDQPLFLVEIA
ncbi:MAG: acetyl-CoA carboxylase biotin carboxyl carrier protein [Flavipsychrobacter sp.]|nr:acetyl-CoA carboxylase biotin carboxyl carrier protein [Flavipsychrobacter sp.]